jgi:hypothetical protein
VASGDTPLPLDTFRLSTECYAKRAHPQRVDVAVHKSAPVEYNCQETNVHSVSSDMDAVDLHGVLGGPPVVIVTSRRASSCELYHSSNYGMFTG